MARQAEKKAKKAAESVAETYWPIILALNAIYFAWLFYSYWRGTDRWTKLSKWHWLFVAITLFLYNLAYTGLVEAAANKTSGSVYLDLLGLTGATQLLSIFTRHAWWLYTVVPAYLVYTYVVPLAKTLWGARGGQADEGETQPEDAKKLAKKERRDSRAAKMRPAR